MTIEHFTKANEGTYTIQIHDGKAKSQSSLVLVGDGKGLTVSKSKSPVTVLLWDKYYKNCEQMFFSNLSIQSGSERSWVPEKRAHQKTRFVKQRKYDKSDKLVPHIVGIVCNTWSVLILLICYVILVLSGPHFSEYLSFHVTDDCTVMLVCKVNAAQHFKDYLTSIAESHFIILAMCLHCSWPMWRKRLHLPGLKRKKKLLLMFHQTQCLDLALFQSPWYDNRRFRDQTLGSINATFSLLCFYCNYFLFQQFSRKDQGIYKAVLSDDRGKDTSVYDISGKGNDMYTICVFYILF